MQEHIPPSTPNVSAEVLIVRSITFRSSTFGGLKSYIREHEHKTGERLTNAAAVDRILRAHLAYTINRRAAHEMMTMARPASALALRTIDNKEGAA